MSENAITMEENMEKSSIADSTAVPTSSDEPSKSNDDDGLQSIASETPKDVIEEPEKIFVEESAELHQNLPVEMETDNKEPILDGLKKLPAEQKASPIKDTVISNHFVCSDMMATNEAVHQEPHTIAPALGSLGLLNQYVSSSDEDDDSSESSSNSSDSESETDSDDDDDSSSVSSNAKINNVTKENQLDAMANNILNDAMSRNNYRDVSSDTSDTDSVDSDVECMGSIAAPSTVDITNDEEIQEFLDACDDTAALAGPVKAKGEFSIADLPPIEELTITVPESECVQLGKVSGIVGTLVLVESLPNFAAVDIDTVLFLDKGNRTLGQVFDVMGNVASPIYCVRFNSVQDITAKDIKSGLHVYVAPQTEYTNFIVLSDLIKQKGCDASWENDHEAPDGLEFSDDEEERLARRMHNQRQHNRNRSTSTSNEQAAPNKVVKTEKSHQPNGRPAFDQHQHRMAKGNKPPTRFYKEHRGYANANTDSNLYQHQQFQQHHPNFQQQQQMQQHQRMQAMHHNYSWHTAGAMNGMPSSSYAQPPYTPPNGGPTMYPNPFALANHLNGPFNLQAFPPLPPPMSTPPPSVHHQHHHHQPPASTSGSRFNRKNSNSHQNQQ